MPFGDPPVGGIDLSRPTGIQVRDMHILIPSGITFNKGGADRDGCVMRAEVIDIAHQTLYIVPIAEQGAVAIFRQFENVLDELGLIHVERD
jgi:hypothetical protein